MAAPIRFLVDNFSSTDVADQWGPYGTPDPTQVDGAISIPCTSGYSGIESVGTFDLTGGACYIEVGEVPNTGNGSTEAAFDLAQNSNNKVLWLITNGTLRPYKKVSGTTTALGSSMTYDPVAHRWLRIRESSGTTYWDTSPDGETWTVRHSVSNPITVTALKANFSAGYYDTEPEPGEFVLLNLNTDGTTIWSDDFEAYSTGNWTDLTTRGPWTSEEGTAGNNSIESDGGSKVVSLDIPSGDYGVVYTTGLTYQDVDLTVRVKAEARPVGGDTYQSPAIQWRVVDGDNYYFANIFEDFFELYVRVGGTNTWITEGDNATQTGQWYDFRINHFQDQITVFINGFPVKQVTDSQHTAGGGVALTTGDDAHSHFDNVTLAYASDVDLNFPNPVTEGTYLDVDFEDYEVRDWAEGEVVGQFYAWTGGSNVSVV